MFIFAFWRKMWQNKNDILTGDYYAGHNHKAIIEMVWRK